MTIKLLDAFSKNRNEESTEDNWAEFIVPKFIHDLGIKGQTKALVIVGGRGCGKTTLLKYFSHRTQFSPKRKKLHADDLRHIGIYWRADTNFLNSFAGGGEPTERWRAAFEHLLACELGKEILASLRTLNTGSQRNDSYGGLDRLDFKSLQDFDETIGSQLLEVEKYLHSSRARLATWINNIDSTKPPLFLPVVAFLSELIGALRTQLPYLAASTFAVFVDEYENLRNEQQRIVNGLIKHGAAPLIFNIAMKRNGWSTLETLGPESIENISDYREIDLEGEIEEDFELFAAEVLFFRLAEHRKDLEDALPIEVDLLRSVEQSDLDKRYKSAAYREKVLEAAESVLPRTGEQAAAIEILTDAKLSLVLEGRIKEVLKQRGSTLEPYQFMDKEAPVASVIMPALLARPKESVDKLAKEFADHRAGLETRFDPSDSLVANNLFGCVNLLYIEARRPSVLFSGFAAITLIARHNIRHFLELVHRIFKEYERYNSVADNLPVVGPDVQITATRDASESILNKVKGQGTYGPQLYAMTQCIGAIFRERHRNARQSESEINHFTVKTQELDSVLNQYLEEAEKWSVLFRSVETKKKGTGAPDSDYVLNPIFSPHFQISYRKKRSLPLTAAQMKVMFAGDQASRDALVRSVGARASQTADLFDE